MPAESALLLKTRSDGKRTAPDWVRNVDNEVQNLRRALAPSPPLL